MGCESLQPPLLTAEEASLTRADSSVVLWGVCSYLEGNLIATLCPFSRKHQEIGHRAYVISSLGFLAGSQ